MENYDPESGPASDPREWVDLYADYLYNFAYSRLSNADVAQELVQETFLAALRSHTSFKGQSSERTWLVGILRHKIVDHIRKLVRERSGTDRLIEDNDPGSMFKTTGRFTGDWNPRLAPKQWSEDPSVSLEQQEFWTVLRTCLGELPGNLGQVFTLITVEEFSAETACKELGITATNLRVRLYRARLLMRRCLEINWFGKER